MPILAFYMWCDQRDVQFWDVGEMQTVPWIFGIAHPTGFPLYTLLGWLFAHCFAIGSVAWRMSVFSSVATCATGSLLYAMIRSETGQAWVGIASAYCFDATSIAWSRGTRADVHPLAACLALASVCALFRWQRTRDERWFIASFAALGAALAVHPVALFAIPSLLAVVVAEAARVSPKSAARAAVAFVVPLLSYATIPLRSKLLAAQRRDPTLALGLPAGAPFWDYGHTALPRNFLWFVTGAQFHREAGLAGYTDAGTFAAAVHFGGALVFREYGWFLIGLATLGLVVTAMRSPSRATAFALLAAAGVPYAAAYGEEADKERYLLITLFAVACLIGLGAAAIVTSIERRSARWLRHAGRLVAIALVVLAARQFYENLNVVAIDRDTVARRYVAQVAALTPDDAILVADWTYATPLAYAAYVEGSLRRRVVVAGTLASLEPHLDGWSRARCVAYAGGSKTPDALATRLHAVLRNGSLPYIFTLGDCFATRPAAGAHGAIAAAMRAAARARDRAPYRR